MNEFESSESLAAKYADEPAVRRASRRVAELLPCLLHTTAVGNRDGEWLDGMARRTEAERVGIVRPPHSVPKPSLALAGLAFPQPLRFRSESDLRDTISQQLLQKDAVPSAFLRASSGRPVGESIGRGYPEGLKSNPAIGQIRGGLERPSQTR